MGTGVCLCLAALTAMLQVRIVIGLEGIYMIMSMLCFSGTACGQSNGPTLHRWGVWRKRETNTISLPCSEDAADPARN